MGWPRLFPTFDFVWNITGIILAATSQTCSDVMPDVYHSILAFASAVLGRIHAGTEAEDLVVSVFQVSPSFDWNRLPNTALQLEPVNSGCGLFIAVWFLINAVGLQVILAYMMRHGMLHSADPRLDQHLSPCNPQVGVVPAYLRSFPLHSLTSFIDWVFQGKCCPKGHD